MRISIASKGDLVSIYSKDFDIDVVERVKDKEILGKRFYGLMYGIRRAVAMIKPKIEELRPDEIITFELSNVTLVKWLQYDTPNQEYEVYFTKLMDELNMLPMKYSFIHLVDIDAKKHLDEAHLEKVSLSGLEDML